MALKSGTGTYQGNGIKRHKYALQFLLYFYFNGAKGFKVTIKYKLWLGSCCGKVGRAVTSDTSLNPVMAILFTISTVFNKLYRKD